VPDPRIANVNLAAFRALPLAMEFLVDDVRYGSKADIELVSPNVRFVPLTDLDRGWTKSSIR
jgi:hypothetical protein